VGIFLFVECALLSWAFDDLLPQPLHFEHVFSVVVPIFLVFGVYLCFDWVWCSSAQNER
jgi:hypothetical protein